MPQPSLLRSELDEVGVPSGWTQTDEFDEKGGCFTICANVTRTYDVPGPGDEALEQLAERFDEYGYDLSPVEFDESGQGPNSVTASTGGLGPDGILDLEATSEDDLTEVRINLKGQ